MSCLFGHHYIEADRGLGGYQYCGVVTATGIPMAVLLCTKCGKRKIVEL